MIQQQGYSAHRQTRAIQTRIILLGSLSIRADVQLLTLIKMLIAIYVMTALGMLRFRWTEYVMFLFKLANYYNNCLSYSPSGTKYQNHTFTGEIIKVCVNCSNCCTKCIDTLYVSGGRCYNCTTQWGTTCKLCNSSTCLECINELWAVNGTTCTSCVNKFAQCVYCTNTACTGCKTTNFTIVNG